jgi:hypothetical protein
VHGALSHRRTLDNSISLKCGSFFGSQAQMPYHPHKAGTIMSINFESIHHEISKASYHKYEKRGFEPGYELDDWLRAESEIMAFYWYY